MADAAPILDDIPETVHSDSENYTVSDEASPSSRSSSGNTPLILYSPPTLWGLVRGAAINLLLPFVNGLMLGFGELLAHEAAFRLGCGDEVLSAPLPFPHVPHVPHVAPERAGLTFSATQIFPSHRSGHSIGPGIEVRDDPVERRRRNGEEMDMYTKSQNRASICDGADSRHDLVGECHQSSALGTRPPFRMQLLKVVTTRHPLRTHHTSIMPPSRGVCAACRVQGLQARATHLQYSSRRQFSQASTFALPSRFHSPRSFAAPRALLLSSSVLYSAPRSLPLSQSRLQSTVPSASVSATASAASPSNSSPALDSQAGALGQSSDFLSTDYVPPPLPTEAYIGWLHDLGINFGYGPSSCIKWLFEHVHVFSGLPFWGSIAITAAICRVTLVPLIMMSSDTSSRLAAVTELTKPKMEEMKVAAAAQDQATLQRLRGEMKSIYKGAGVQMWKMALPLVQLPMGFGLWRLTRNIADLPVPGLETGGILWFVDLTTRDPTFILPFVVAVLQHLSVKLGVESSANVANPAMKKFMLFGLPALSIPIIGWAPAAVQLNFAVTACVALFTNAIMRNPALRRSLGLSPIIRNKPAAGAGPASPYKGTITVSGRATDHPETLRRQKQAAEAAARRAERDVPWSKKVSPSYLVQSGSKMFQGITDQVSKVMPLASQKQSSAVKKRTKRAADEYEKKRVAEIERERADFERGRRR
ncbi:hypothetical protein FH972_024594 [Carpinus fangiana]|uniref:Membrane insertase YidC/Oxa/ALB C-terminal domain-containing protein n=1 Tax=Carpinus fangiana TaxID=176857 RepID=A0A5N6KYV2_9ROSI|nr:hypothetical protein FH972_024594 [Carpinus fangiana]